MNNYNILTATSTWANWLPAASPPLNIDAQLATIKKEHTPVMRRGEATASTGYVCAKCGEPWGLRGCAYTAIAGAISDERVRCLETTAASTKAVEDARAAADQQRVRANHLLAILTRRRTTTIVSSPGLDALTVSIEVPPDILHEGGDAAGAFVAHEVVGHVDAWLARHRPPPPPVTPTFTPPPPTAEQATELRGGTVTGQSGQSMDEEAVAFFLPDQLIPQFHMPTPVDNVGGIYRDRFGHTTDYAHPDRQRCNRIGGALIRCTRRTHHPGSHYAFDPDRSVIYARWTNTGAHLCTERHPEHGFCNAGEGHDGPCQFR